MDANARSRRKALKVAVGALCTEVGFGMAEESALETLTEMLQSLLTEIGRSSKAYTELCGRTEVMVTDVLMALIDQGINVESIPAHAHRANKSVFIPPGQSGPQTSPRTLSTGDRQEHPSHIPDYLPAFPDPHTYIRSDTHKQPVTEYQIIREKAASHKLEVERALTRFVAKTGQIQSLFKDDTSAFPLISVQPHPQPYLNALLPKDQDLDSHIELGDAGSQPEFKVQTAETSQNAAENFDPDTIDNPYLQPVRMPKFKKKI